MAIIDYIHRRLYENNFEAQEIWRVTQPEINDLQAEILRIFDNTRASLADIEGIEIWERVYNIFPDLSMDTDEERRDRVLERKRDRPPFTETWLIGNDFDIYDADFIKGEISKRFPDGEVLIEMQGLRMYVYLDVGIAGLNEKGFVRREFRELFAWLRGWIPANILLMAIAVTRREIPETFLYVGSVICERHTIRSFDPIGVI